MDDSLISKITQSGGFNEHYIWASFLWGTIAGGYCLFGWKQRSLIAFLGGLAMTAATFLILSALWLSLASIAVMLAVWWLVRQGF